MPVHSLPSLGHGDAGARRDVVVLTAASKSADALEVNILGSIVAVLTAVVLIVIADRAGLGRRT